MLGALVLCLAAGGAPAAEMPTDAPAASSSRPRPLRDAALAAAASAAIAFGKPDIRRALGRDARLSHVVENFRHPLRQLRRGTQRDGDPFWVNNVAHPGLFALEALCLKRRGYGDGGAFLFTQVHSVMWEFSIEGAAFEPSAKDLLADAAGAAAALWILRPVASRAARRLAEGRGRWWDRGLRWFDPLSRGAGRGRGLVVHPLPAAQGAGLAVTAAF